MGKNNRLKSKRIKMHVPKIKIMARVLPSPRSIIESKEKLIDELKQLYSKYLKQFTNMMHTRKQNMLIKPLKASTLLNMFSTFDFHFHDSSSEFTQIFTLQVDRFISSIILNLHEVYYVSPSIMKACIKDSHTILQLACKEAQKLTSSLFNHSDDSYEVVSFTLFQERVLKDQLIMKFFKESLQKEQENSIANSPSRGEEKDVETNVQPVVKKKEKRKRKKETWNLDELDQEVEEFKSKLELEVPASCKIRPNFTDDWIAGLRRRLKG